MRPRGRLIMSVILQKYMTLPMVFRHRTQIIYCAQVMDISGLADIAELYVIMVRHLSGWMRPKVLPAAEGYLKTVSAEYGLPRTIMVS